MAPLKHFISMTSNYHSAVSLYRCLRNSLAHPRLQKYKQRSVLLLADSQDSITSDPAC